MKDAKGIFDKISTKNSKNPLVIFDLDSTLFRVSGRTRRILLDLSENPQELQDQAHIANDLRTIDVRENDWGIFAPLNRLGIGLTHKAFPIIRKFWRKHFFSSEYLVHDQPYPGAVNFVNQLRSEGAKIAYLTGRDYENMHKGTLKSLNQWGFPLEEKQLLHMKPLKGSSSDERFKTEKLYDIKTSSENIWFFENEPLILNQVEKDHPEINLVFIDTVHSGRAESPTHLPTIRGKFDF